MIMKNTEKSMMKLYHHITFLVNYETNNPINALRECFNINLEEKDIINECYKSLYKLVYQSRLDFEKMKISDKKEYLMTLDIVISGLDKIDLCNKVSGLISFKKFFNPELITSLKFCFLFTTHYDEIVYFTENELEVIYNEISMLKKDLESMNSSSKAKEAFRAITERMQGLLEEYDSYRSYEVNSIILESIENIRCHLEELDNPKDEKMIIKLINIMKKIYNKWLSPSLQNICNIDTTFKVGQYIAEFLKLMEIIPTN